MRKRNATSWLAVCAFGAASFVVTTAAAQDPTLPLARVRLYETGVGYFERTGTLGKAEKASLPVPAGHLDDALKTLVVLSRDSAASVDGIGFSSSLSPGMSRALAGVAGSADEPLRYVDLVKSLKGARVALTTKQGVVEGRLVEVLDREQSGDTECIPTTKLVSETKQPQSGDCYLKRHVTLTVLTDDRALRRFRAAEVVSIQPKDPDHAARLGAALDGLGARGAQARKQLEVLGEKGSELTLGYVAESPVWRAAYRVVLPDSDERATLQGWALVHNDTDEDWKQIRVELVNGRPDSFLFPLAAPRYAGRKLVTPERELMTVPQLMGRTPDSLWSDEAASGAMWGDEIGDAYGSGGLGLSGVGEGGGGSGEGIGLGTIGTVGHGAGAGGGASSQLSVGDLAKVATAKGIESQALFLYALPKPVDLGARSSALLPFFSGSVSARRMAWFSRPGGPGRSAVWFQNDTRQTLPPGTVAFFADAGFAGESALARLKPGEARVVAFGWDPDVQLTRRITSLADQTKLLGFDGSRLVEHYVRTRLVTYRITNKGGAGRSVYVDLDAVENAKVAGSDSIEFDEARHRAMLVFRVDAKKRVERRVTITEGLRRSSATPGSRELRRMAKSTRLPKRQRRVLLKAAERLLEAEVRRGGMKRRGRELAEIEGEVASLQGHLKAVGGGRSDAVTELLDRILAAEARAKRVRRRIRELGAEAKLREAKARAILAQLGNG